MRTPRMIMIYIVRSLVPTREIGFLPGDHEDKAALYQIPYKNMVRYMFSMPDDNEEAEMLYDNLRAQETIGSEPHVIPSWCDWTTVLLSWMGSPT